MPYSFAISKNWEVPAENFKVDLLELNNAIVECLKKWEQLCDSSSYICLTLQHISINIKERKNNCQLWNSSHISCHFFFRRWSTSLVFFKTVPGESAIRRISIFYLLAYELIMGSECFRVDREWDPEAFLFIPYSFLFSPY